MGDEEPPRKKRRSKWDMTAPPVTTAQSSSPPVPAPPSNSDGSHPPLVEGARGTGDPPQGGAVSTAVAAAAAAKLNAMLASQGKLLKSDPPLAKPAPPTPSLLPPPASHTNPLTSNAGLLKPTGLLAPPSTPPIFTTSSTPGGPHYVQDKIFVGLEQAPETFKVTEKLQGPNSSFLQHIATQTGAKVFLRGRGSGYIEPTSGKESFEALHVYISHPNKSGLSSARKLSESLIDTVKKEYETFKTSQQAPLGFGSTPGYRPPPAHGYVNHYHTSFPPPGAPLPPGHTHHPGYPPMPAYGLGYQAQPHPPVPPGPPGPPGPPPPAPNYGYFPPGGGGVPPPQPQSDPYPTSLPPPPGPPAPHPGAFYPPYAAGSGAEFGAPPPPHPGHFHPPPPSHLPPGPIDTQEVNLYKPHNRSPEPPPKRKFTEQVERPPSPSEEKKEEDKEQRHQHFSISITGSSSMSADVETSQGNSGSAGNGLPSQSTESVEEKKSETHSRKFVEGPLPVVSSSNERMTHGNVPSDHVGGGVMGDGTATVKDNVITTSLEKEVSGDVMKPPSLPPPSRLKEVTTFMPPPPSLPPRFGKSSPVDPTPAPPPAPSTTADSATGPADSVGSPKPAKLLSSLVAYGDDSDSDLDS